MRFAFGILLIVICLSACSRRVEYSSVSNAVADPAAVNLNTADVVELERLPHIGRKTAEAIIDHRAQNGPFRRVEDLLLVRGISERRFADLRAHVRVE